MIFLLSFFLRPLDPLPGPKLIVYDMLLEAAIKNLDKLALVCMHQSPSPPHRFDVRSGYQIWDVNHSICNNCAKSHVLWWAARELNCPFATFLPRVASSKEDARHLLEMISLSVILAQETSVAEKLEGVAPETMESVKFKIFSPSSTEGTVPKHWLDLEKFAPKGLEKGLEELKSVEIDMRLEDAILILTTSGTNSLPKGCANTNFTFCNLIQTFIANEEPSPDRVRVKYDVTAGR